MKPETRQEISIRLVTEAEGLVERQRELVVELQKNGHRTDASLVVLGDFEVALANFRHTLALMQAVRPEAN